MSNNIYITKEKNTEENKYKILRIPLQFNSIMLWNIQVVITLGDFIHDTQRNGLVLFQWNYVEITLTLFPGAAELVFRRASLSDNLWEEDAALLKFCWITLVTPASKETAFCMIFTTSFLFIFSSDSCQK